MSLRVWEFAYEEKLTALHKHASQLSLANSIGEITKFTLDAMEFVLGFDFADVAIVENRSLKVAGSRGARPLLLETPLNGPGIKVKAANTRTTVKVPDTRKEPVYVDEKGFDWKGPPTMLSELAVPVVVDCETVAVLNVKSKLLKAFTVEDQDLLEILAFHVGSVFKRLKYEERLVALHRHALQLSVATSTDEIAKYTLDAMEFALGFDCADLRVVKEGWLRCKGARGMEMVYADLPLDGLGVTVKAANSKKTVRVPDTRKERSYVDRIRADWKNSPTMLSELAVPVIVENAAVAVLNVESAQSNAITDDDQALLETLAFHVASDIRRLRDLETLRKSEQHLEELVEKRTKQLSEAQRLAAIGQTTAMVGHDLRNPLQGITGALYMLRKHYENMPKNQKKLASKYGVLDLLTLVEESLAYMDKIVSDLQNYAAPIQPELMAVSLDQLLKETLSTIHSPGNVKLSTNVEEGVQRLTVDPALMKRVFTNLASNAVQAMPRGGELRITAQKNGKDALISFQDTGDGIPEEHLRMLFTPFRTTKAQGQGLGLPVCKRLVEAHGGSLTVETTVGRGSTFTVRIPVRRDEGGVPHGMGNEAYLDH